MLLFFSRLDNFMKYKGLNDNKITVEAGISNGIIGKARKRGALSQENISKILFKYPELNANWLLTGTGEMLQKEAPPTGMPPSPTHPAPTPTACTACITKERTIAQLNKLIEHQERLIASLEKSAQAQAPHYSQTA